MNHQDLQITEKAVDILQGGGVIIFPTDTVHGLGCALSHQKAIERIYQIKRRDPKQPTAVLVGSIEQAERIAHLNDQAKKLVGRFWPGGLTIVVRAKTEWVPVLARGQTETVGLRLPNLPIITTMINLLGEPLLTTSANFAGEPPATNGETLDERLKNLVDYIIPGSSLGKEASTVVDLTKQPFSIVREGIIPKSEVEKELDKD